MSDHGIVPLEDDRAQLEQPLLEHQVEEAASEDTHEDTPDETSTKYGRWLLGVVAFLYATYNVSLRLVYSFPDPPSASALSMTRGWMSLACFLPLLVGGGKPQNLQESSDVPARLPLWTAAAELAFWNFTSQSMFNVGLLTTPSARASFLGQTTVVMVPMISAVAGEKLRWTVWMGCLASILGLGLLSYEDSSSASAIGLGMGDLLVLSGALCWSFYVFRISAIASSYDDISLQGTKNFFLAILYTAWFVFSMLRSDENLWLGWKNPVAWAILAYSAVGPGTIADILQQKGQASLAATESNLILCMEPVFTAILGRAILGEETSWMDKLGGSCLILGALVSTR